MPTYFTRILEDKPPSEDRFGLVESVASLIYDKGQSVEILGEGGVGKTVLLRQVLHPDTMRKYGVDAEKFLFAGVAGEDILGRTSDEFWTELVLPQLIEGLHERGKPDLAQTIEQLRGKPKRVRATVDEALYRLKKEGMKVLLSWDDFTWVLENPALDLDFFNHLRSLANSKNDYSVTYLIASDRPLERLAISSPVVSPLFNIFYKVQLTRQ